MTDTYKYEHLRADSEFQFDSCPPGLGFDVIAELVAPTHCYSDNFMPDVSDLRHVWMEIGSTIENTVWLDIKKSLPPAILEEIVQSLDKQS